MYTFIPKEKHAKAYGSNLKISTKSAAKICSVIKSKPLKRVKRLLNDLSTERRNLRGKFYSKTVSNILELLESCEKNAEFLGLENERLFVHASASMGSTMRRRRRKSSFGSKMKSTNVEIILIEKGKSVEKEKTKEEKETGGKTVEQTTEKVKEDTTKKTNELKGVENERKNIHRKS